MKKYVAYYRVSTQHQGAEGLGIESQQARVRDYCKSGELINEFLEVVSGTGKQIRTKIFEALEFAKENGAVLIVARLDRLCRDVAFLQYILSSGVEFVACDYPGTNKMILNIMMSIAEYEAQRISENTKAALKAAKAKGKKLGNPHNLTTEARLTSICVRSSRANSNENNIRASAMIKMLLKEGNTKAATADYLNRNGFKTSKGNYFNSNSVIDLQRRVG